MKASGVRYLRHAAILLASSLASALMAESLQCDDPRFTASGDDRHTLNQVCQTAAVAKRKLESCGVTLETPVEIKVSDYVEGELGECLGIFHCGQGRIEILSPSAMSEARGREGVFGHVDDTAFWESVLVHELTHAAYDSVSCPFSSCTATAEFAAYAMQVYSLPETDIAEFGRDIVTLGEQTRDAISELMLYFSPDRFAYLSWQHFQAQPDSCAFMGRVMRGEEFFDSEPF